MVQLVKEVTETIVIRSGQQGVQGPPGVDGLGIIQADTLDITTSTPEVVDSVAIADTRSVKWIVTVTDNTTGKHRISEILAVKTSTGASHQHYGISGDFLDYLLNVVVSGSNFQLTFISNEINDLDVQVLRLATFI